MWQCVIRLAYPLQVALVLARLRTFLATLFLKVQCKDQQSFISVVEVVVLLLTSGIVDGALGLGGGAS